VNIIRYLNIINELRCRIIYTISDFPTIADIINKQESKDNLISLIKQACLYILYAFTFGMSLFLGYILLMLGCVLSDSCYYYYGGV